MIRPCNRVVILMDITDQEDITRHTVTIPVIRRRGIMAATLVIPVRRVTILAGKTENILEEMGFTPPFRMQPITITQDIPTLLRLLFLGNDLDLIPMLCYIKARRRIR